MPGIGDIAESITSVTIMSANAVKSSFGVTILLILILIIIIPILKVFMILGTIRLATALGSIAGGQRMLKCTQYLTDAGSTASYAGYFIGTVFCVDCGNYQSNFRITGRSYGTTGHTDAGAYLYGNLFSMPFADYTGEYISEIPETVHVSADLVYLLSDSDELC